MSPILVKSALGSSVPEEHQWLDLALFAAGGGNLWRPGHSTTSEELVDAADAFRLSKQGHTAGKIAVRVSSDAGAETLNA